MLVPSVRHASPVPTRTGFKLFEVFGIALGSRRPWTPPRRGGGTRRGQVVPGCSGHARVSPRAQPARFRLSGSSARAIALPPLAEPETLRLAPSQCLRAFGVLGGTALQAGSPPPSKGRRRRRRFVALAAGDAPASTPCEPIASCRPLLVAPPAGPPPATAGGRSRARARASACARGVTRIAWVVVSPAQQTQSGLPGWRAMECGSGGRAGGRSGVRAGWTGGRWAVRRSGGQAGWLAGGVVGGRAG